MSSGTTNNPFWPGRTYFDVFKRHCQHAEILKYILRPGMIMPIELFMPFHRKRVGKAKLKKCSRGEKL